jgi:hypothetical protein
MYKVVSPLKTAVYQGSLLIEPNQALLQPKAEGRKGALAREGLKIGI